jgi:peptide/nickel transport system substrate-binding protein
MPIGRGSVVVATTTDDDLLFPPLVTGTTGRQVTEMVYDYLTEVGPSLNTFDDKTFARRLAKSWEWSPDSLSLAVHLDPQAKWHDGQPVRSEDILYTYNVYTDSLIGSSTASQLARIDSITTQDSTTIVFWFKERYPLQFYDATSQMQIVPKHIFGRVPNSSLRDSIGSISPIGSGRYRFVNWKHGESIELGADTLNYRGTPRIARLIWRVFPSPVAAAKAVITGDVDGYDTMRPENVAEAAKTRDVKVVTGPGSDYVFMTYNLKTPIFASREMRRALTMAVDRQSMVRNVFDTLARVAVGPTISSFPSTDPNLHQIPYDPANASRVLDSLGWKVDRATGVRARNGRRLQFNVLVPSSSLNRRQMGTLLQEQLRQIGVAVILDQLDNSTMMDRATNKNFDAALLTWHLGTSPAAIRELWTSEAAGKDGNNFGSWKNPQFDAYVDSAVSTMDPAKSKAYYNRAYQIAIEDPPAIWLYEPKMVLGINKRIHTGPMRPDAWWYSLPDWYIPSNERIARDKIR